jgi:diguanylate cyclase (GGDEF)-like protein
VVIRTKDPRLLGRRFVLDRSPVLVGRGPDNHIVLQDASVSPGHAHLEERDAAWWCVEDDSTNGTYVDDLRSSSPAPLAPGTRIGIGSTIFKFLCGRDLETQYHEEIYWMTVRDGLTQVYLERYLVEALDKEILRAGRLGRPLALLMVAVDELGTPDGSTSVPNARDHVLRQVASRLRRSVPRDGILARYGAERFVIVLPDHTLETARAIAECVREGAGDSSPPVGPRVTVSIGGAQWRGDDRARRDILERASRALDVARSWGRNQLACKVVDEGPSSEPRS